MATTSPRALRGSGKNVEPELGAIGVDNDLPPALQLPEEDLIDERLLDLLLDEAGHRTGAESAVVAVFRQPGASRFLQIERHVLRPELRAQFVDELVGHAFGGLEAERVEGDPGIEAVAELGS